jgi:hypothetical protein
MADRDPDLTEADRRAIDAIRRELDAEFGPLEAATPLELRDDDAPVARAGRDVRVSDDPSGDDDVRRHDDVLGDEDFRGDDIVHDDRHVFADDAGSAWSSRPGVVAAFVAGILIGALLGGAGTLLWLRTPAETPRSAAGPPDASASPPSAEAPPREVGLDASSLREALDEWLDATRRGDIAAQMRFYPRRVPVYYTWHDVTHDAVQAEKQKVFGDATRLEITTGQPTIDLARNGSTAVTRFRKRYVIDGPVQRRGEVLQELRWQRTDRGWMITSERDARVLRSE